MHLVAQSLESMHRLREDEKNVGEGTLGALRSGPRYLVYLARGCDTFHVTLCEGILGRDLYDGLRLAGDAARTLLTNNGFPAPINNRVAYDLAALTWGGRDRHSVRDCALSAADFPRC